MGLSEMKFVVLPPAGVLARTFFRCSFGSCCVFYVK